MARGGGAAALGAALRAAVVEAIDAHRGGTSPLLRVLRGVLDEVYVFESNADLAALERFEMAEAARSTQNAQQRARATSLGAVVLSSDDHGEIMDELEQR